MAVNLTYCTMGWVDERTDPADIASLSDQHPYAEWAFIYTGDERTRREGHLSYESIMDYTVRLPDYVARSVHFDTVATQHLLARRPQEMALVAAVKKAYGRIQLDLLTADNNIINIPQINKLIDDLQTRITVSRTAATKDIHNVLQGLLDDPPAILSVGLDVWSAPTNNVSGYAADIDINNIHQRLGEIEALTGIYPAWVQITDGVQTVDSHGLSWLDINRCRDILDSVHQHLKKGNV